LPRIDDRGQRCVRKKVAEQGSEAAGEDANRQKEGTLSNASPATVVRGEAAAGNDEVQVRMKKECLGPGVKDRQRPDANMEPTLSDLRQRGAGGAEEQIVKETRCAPGDDVELLGYGEDDMEVRHRKQL